MEGVGKTGVTANGYKVSFRSTWKRSETICGDGYATLQICQKALNWGLP